MAEKKNTHRKNKPIQATEETLEDIIDKSKTSAEAYRKILNSIQLKLKNK